MACSKRIHVYEQVYWVLINSITLREGFGLISLISAYNLDKNLTFYSGM